MLRYYSMAYSRTFYSFKNFLILILPVLFTACEKFEGDQTVPAYLKVDSIALVTDYATEGTASNSITDAWVYIDDVYLGTFELPARVPVLKTGKHKVTIFAGIKQNGIATTRISYPFYEGITRNLNFTPDSTSSLGTVQTTYMESARFLFREDFEQSGILLDTTPRSDAYIQKTPAGSPYSYPADGLHSGMIVMDTSNTFFECMSHDPMDIPNAPVYLEMNFNSNQEFSVGAFIYSSTMIYQSNVLTLFPTNGSWKKICINLTNTINAYPGGTKFRLTIGTYRNTSLDVSRIIIDNLKVVTLSGK